MLDVLKRLFRPGREPIDYAIPLSWFDQQLPGDLLETRLYWVWESSRAGKAAHAGVPAERRRTALTLALAPEITKEIGEYDGEIGREFVAFATAEPIELTAAQLIAAIRAFAKSGGGPLVAILYQDPAGPGHFLIAANPLPALSSLLETWAVRLGKPVSQVQQSSGRPLLKGLFLNKETISSGALKGFPPVS
ncbi:MAG TPA: hypothetical protein VGL53_03230 [Bryobacteraceae bacterium]|jgi:hypothetical protein